MVTNLEKYFELPKQADEKERQITSVLRNGGFSASYKTFC